jgi:hypothetical protein
MKSCSKKKRSYKTKYLAMMADIDDRSGALVLLLLASFAGRLLKLTKGMVLMLNIVKLENGKVVINGDEQFASQLEGADLSGVDVSEYRVTADDLQEAFVKASAQPVKDVGAGQVDNVKKYGKLKQLYIDAFSA